MILLVVDLLLPLDLVSATESSNLFSEIGLFQGFKDCCGCSWRIVEALLRLIPVALPIKERTA